MKNLFIKTIIFITIGFYSNLFSSNTEQQTLKKGQLLSVPNYKSELSLNYSTKDSSVIFKEDFEDGGLFWTSSGIWNIGEPSTGPGSGFNSLNCAATNLDGDYEDNVDDWLISSEINLPELSHSGDELQLAFWEWYEIESGWDHGKVLISNDNGATWDELEDRSGSSNWRRTFLDISTYANQSIKIAFQLTSDGSVSYNGWYIDQVKVLERLEKNLSLNLNNLNHSNFPFIYLNAVVDTFDSGISSLNSTNFEVFENSSIQTDYFEVTPPEEGGGSRVSDIVFVLDVTGSMGDELEQVKINMEEFVDSLAASDIDYGIGFVVFGDITYTYNNGNFYYDKETILTIIDNIEIGENGIGNGGDRPENQLQAMADGALMNFRPGAQKVEIMLTDADAHEDDDVSSWTVPELIDLLNNNNVSVYPVFDTGESLQNNQYIPIAEETNVDGDFYYIYDSFNDIINDISETIGNNYVIRYKSSNPVYDGVERHVEVKVNYAGETNSDYGSYLPGSSPKIKRTEETIALHEQAWAEGTEFDIKAEITDEVEPYVESVNLYYRTTGENDYKSVSMSLLNEDIYHAVIPTSDVLTPGLDYYISASDGQSSTSDPSVDPSSNPYSIAILPNEAPMIVHSPVNYGVIGDSIIIQAEIKDNTNMLENTKLFYRKTGQLIYEKTEMYNIEDDNFRATIPAYYMTEDGVDYFIKATDNFSVNSTHGTFDKPNQILPEYVLHKIESDNIEYFDIMSDSWRFGNYENNMWPESWWTQFDYSDSEKYPLGWGWADFDSERFPDWPLFVDAFGEDQCYWNPPPGLVIYNPLAVREWLFRSNPQIDTSKNPPDTLYWKGSCFGFAISAFLAFDDKTAFLNEFPNVGEFSELYSLDINDYRRKCINQLWVYQYGDERVDYIDQHEDDSPVETLEELKEMLQNESQNHRILVFYHQNGSGGHAVNPVKLYRDKDNPAKYNILVYDNNYPGNKFLELSINTNTNQWEYPLMHNWGGSKGLFLMDNVMSYLENPQLSSQPKSNPKIAREQSLNDKFIIYNSPNADIIIKNKFNQHIGYSDSISYDGFVEGIPLIPITGQFHPPIGYYIPSENYTIKMSEFTTFSNYITVISDTVTYQYSRFGVNTEQEDVFSIGDYFKVQNKDPVNKLISVESFIDRGSEFKTIKLDNYDIFQNDSSLFKVVGNDEFKTINYGSEKKYDISLELLGDSSKINFEHFNVNLKDNSTHLISPNWKNIEEEPVLIYSDIGNDGIVDDTIEVENQYTGIQIGNKYNYKIPETYFLGQNYPNPFNNSTSIRFGLPKTSHVKLEIFNINGQKIRTLLNKQMRMGVHNCKLNGKDLASGFYFYRLKTEKYSSVKKMILIK